MDSAARTEALRELLNRLTRLLYEPWNAPVAVWYLSLDERIQALEELIDTESRPLPRAALLAGGDAERPHLPRSCAEFQRDGQRLLCSMADVVRLSISEHDVRQSPSPVLCAATSALIDAVESYLTLEGQLSAAVLR